MLLRQVFLQAKFFARKKHEVRICKPKKEKKFDLGFKFEKNVMVCFSNVYVRNKMAINEEDLSISVQKYTVLFDKAHKEFHRKDIKRNTWKAVAEELGFEDGKNI